MKSPRTLAVFATMCLLPLAVGQEKPKLYVVPYAHLDTQWRWSYPQVIREYLWNTMEDNFRLFDKYPDYVFNFGGSRRFEMMKEYFPGEYAKVVQAVKKGRWFPAPASVDETEVNIISGESVIRNVLYGNQFYKKEFGVTSAEFMRPDSFGFPYSLPTLLVHSGLKGFSTQKLYWGSAVGIPFSVGVWVGPDGNGIVSALDPTSYVSSVDGDLSTDKDWVKRVQNSPLKIDYRYYGTGDRGGAPAESSVMNGSLSVKGTGPIQVIQSTADAMFKDLTPTQVAALPRYQGEFLLTEHSAGSMTSHTEMKRWNRQNELLADAAERASVASVIWAQRAYPFNQINRAWDLALGSQMHDMLPGTCLPKAYEYAQNDEVIAQNQFASILTSAMGAVTSQLDTRTKWLPLVVYNPLSIAREDVVEATVPGTGPLNVFDANGQPVPTQVVSSSGGQSKILFLAKVPSVGFSVFDVRKAAVKQRVTVWAEGDVVENPRWRLKINPAGDISSLYDKVAKRETLSAPIQLDLQYENPNDWPAWNMDWKDQSAPPRGHVDGPATIRVVENGPVRATLEVSRKAGSSKYAQRISIASGGAGDHVEIQNDIDWSTRETALKAAFHLASPNPKATYGMQIGAIERPNNHPKAYEVPVHGWMDLSNPKGDYGVSILTPFKYGADKPADDTLRLTLIYTPGTHGGYQDQGVQDFGRHSIPFGIHPHAGSWQTSRIPWSSARLAQPLRAFTVGSHSGRLGKSVSLVNTSSDQVEVQAIKQAEDGNGLIVRIRELTGRPIKTVRIRFPQSVTGAEEVDGQEQSVAEARVIEGSVDADLKGYGIKAFRVNLITPRIAIAKPTVQSVPLPFNVDVVTSKAPFKDGAFDDRGRSYPAQMIPGTIEAGGIQFKLGPTEGNLKNAVAANGQTIRFPKGYDRVYLLVAAKSDTKATFEVGGAKSTTTIPAWDGYVGQWDTRLWKGEEPESAFDWRLPFAGLTPGYIKDSEVAWWSSHRNLPTSGKDYYQYCYLFKKGFRIPAGADQIRLPKLPGVRIFAMSVVKHVNDTVTAAAALRDDLANHTPGGTPTIVAKKDPKGNGTYLTIEPPLYHTTQGTHFTLDGSTPTSKSPQYSEPVLLTKPAKVRAIQIVNGVSSPVATMMVQAEDRIAPSIRLVSLNGELQMGSVQFSERVTKTTAENPASYVVEGSHPEAAKLSADGTRVDLVFAKSFSDAANLVASGVTDYAGNHVAGSPTTATRIAPVFTGPAGETSTTKQFESKAPSDPKAPWTMTLWVKMESQPANLTLLGGFGSPHDGESGTGRYIAKFGSGVHFWSATQDIATNVQYDLGKWQMITVTFDGELGKVYKNDQLIGKVAIRLREDNSQVHLLPEDAWGGNRKATATIRGFTIWDHALPQSAVERIYRQSQ